MSGDGARSEVGDAEESDVTLSYEARWAFNPGEEKKAFERFIDSVMERRRQYPDMHIYHYSAYEPTAIKHLAGRHGVCTDQVDELLRAEVFVDLYRVVRAGTACVSRELLDQEDGTVLRIQADGGFA